MQQPLPQDNEVTLAVVEAGLTLIFFIIAFIVPKLGSSWFSQIERSIVPLARKKGLSVGLVGLSALVLRLVLLPVCPVPAPFVPDDFSFLLAADTFAHGRLSNPTPAMWTHLESIHVTMQPTYMSMYFPGQGLVFAAGKVLFGSPWIALLLVTALMCGAICWMLQAWMPPSWALLGGFLAVLRLGLFSFWINTYTGAGPTLALGGALVLGALPWLMKTARMRYGMLLATGIVILMLTRPYEGLLLCFPVAIVLTRWAFVGKNRPPILVLIRRAALPLAFIVAAGAWLGYYDYRAFGSPKILPYTVDRATYAIAPYYVWQSPRPEPAYRHQALRSFYTGSEIDTYRKIHSVSGYLPESLTKAWTGLVFFAGSALFIPLIMVQRVFRDRRMRFFLFCVIVLAMGMAIEIYLLPHYLSPFTAIFYAIGLQCMRHLRVWKFEGKPVGLTLARLTVTLCIVTAGLRVFGEPLHLKFAKWPPPRWNFLWYGPGHFGTERAELQSRLERLPGKQLVIIRYSVSHNNLDEWVYNDADVEASKVVWAREMKPSENLELIHYYHDRQVWLVEPDTAPNELSNYPLTIQFATVFH